MKSRLAVLKKDRMEDEGFPEPGVDLALRARLRRSLQLMMIGMRSWSGSHLQHRPALITRSKQLFMLLAAVPDS